MKAADGYPYFLQGFGKSAWDIAPTTTISAEVAELAVIDGYLSLDSGFFPARWTRATDSERRAGDAGDDDPRQGAGGRGDEGEDEGEGEGAEHERGVAEHGEGSVEPRVGRPGLLPRSFLDPLKTPDVYRTPGCPGRAVELRGSPEIHDRIIVSEASTVQLLGTSMRAVGAKSTVLVPVPDPAGAILVNHCNQLWEDARRIASTATPGERTEGEPPSAETE